MFEYRVWPSLGNRIRYTMQTKLIDFVKNLRAFAFFQTEGETHFDFFFGERRFFGWPCSAYRGCWSRHFHLVIERFREVSSPCTRAKPIDREEWPTLRKNFAAYNSRSTIDLLVNKFSKWQIFIWNWKSWINLWSIVNCVSGRKEEFRPLSLCWMRLSRVPSKARIYWLFHLLLGLEKGQILIDNYK